MSRNIQFYEMKDERTLSGWEKRVLLLSMKCTKTMIANKKRERQLTDERHDERRRQYLMLTIFIWWILTAIWLLQFSWELHFCYFFCAFFMYVFNLEIVLPSNFCTFYSVQKYSKRTSYFHFCPSFTLFQFSILSSFQFCPIFTSVQFSILSNVKFCQIFNSVKC